MRERITVLAAAMIAAIVAIAAHITIHAARWNPIAQRLVRVLEAGRVRPDTAVRMALDVIALIAAAWNRGDRSAA